MNEGTTLGNKEKALIALAAAMGSGCRRCAENLYGLARSAGATADEIARAFRDGLRVRQSATEVMRRKAGDLLGISLEGDGSTDGREGALITELSRLAAAVAANSSQDALKHLETARAEDSQVGVAIGIGRAIRGKAQSYADSELGELRVETPACPPAGAANAEAPDPATSGTADDCCGDTGDAPQAACGCDGTVPSPKNP
jgi:AhpD family alkylhydroperoxidase